MRSFNKIFCIGYSKSGTWTLHQALLDFNLKSTHEEKIISKIYRDHGVEARNEYINQFDAINTREFNGLDSYFPNSLYIFTYRNPYDVAYSMARHVYDTPPQTKIDPAAYNPDSLYANGNGWTNFSNNVNNVQEYYTSVFNYFYKHKNNFLFLDIINNSKQSYLNLCNFLEVITLKRDFDHLNKSKFT